MVLGDNPTVLCLGSPQMGGPWGAHPPLPLTASPTTTTPAIPLSAMAGPVELWATEVRGLW